MENSYITAEMFRKFLVETFYDDNAILGENYDDWHTKPYSLKGAVFKRLYEIGNPLQCS